MLRYARSSIGLLTNAVQALAGVLLPSDTVFLRLPCNDRAAGPVSQLARAQPFHGRHYRGPGDAKARASSRWAWTPKNLRQPA
jgi:hypothetical protein